MPANARTEAVYFDIAGRPVVLDPAETLAEARAACLSPKGNNHAVREVHDELLNLVIVVGIKSRLPTPEETVRMYQLTLRIQGQ